MMLMFLSSQITIAETENENTADFVGEDIDRYPSYFDRKYSMTSKTLPRLM